MKIKDKRHSSSELKTQRFSGVREYKSIYNSILASLCLHIAALFLLQRHSLWFDSSHKPYSPEGQWISSMKEKDQILKEAFEQLKLPSENISRSHKPSCELITAFPAAQMTPSQPPEKTPSPEHFPPTELLAVQKSISFTLPPLEKTSLFEHLPKDLIFPTLAHPPLVSLMLPPPLPLKPHSPLDPTPPSFEDTLPTAKETPQEPLLVQSSLSERPSLVKPFSPIHLPHLPQLPTLEELETASYSEAFDAELIFLPREEEEEGNYLFALTLIPRPDLELPKIRQHYAFLIDRSNSVQKERLNAEKNAIRRALSELDPEDTFNIIAFDSRMEKLSPTPLTPSKRSIAKAKQFLDQIQLGSFFSSADLYKPLFLTIPAIVREDELYTAILFTDGETLGKKSAQHALLNDWTLYNQGRVTLFGIGLGGDLNLGTLNAAAAFNRGKLLYSPTKRGIKRKLLKLMKTIHTPIAKNLTCKAISRSPSSEIHLFPKASQSPHLYLNEPYIILGTTNSLDDFIIFVQGRLKSRWLNIKKTISFLNAKKAGASLKAEWALQRAYQLYEQYLSDHDSRHLAEAETLLETYDLQSAFR